MALRASSVIGDVRLGSSTPIRHVRFSLGRRPGYAIGLTSLSANKQTRVGTRKMTAHRLNLRLSDAPAPDEALSSRSAT